MNRVSAIVTVGHIISFDLNALVGKGGVHHISALPVGAELSNWNSQDGTFDFRCDQPGVYIFVISTIHDTDPDDRYANVFMVTARAETETKAVEQKVTSLLYDVDVDNVPPPPETFYDGCPVSQIDWSMQQ